MLTRFRQRLGKLKDRLENRVATLSSGGTPAPSEPQITDAEKNLLLQWFTGEIDDQAVIDRARSGPDGRLLLKRASASRPSNGRIWAARAEYSLEDGEAEEALEHAALGFRANATDPTVALVYIRTLIVAGRREEALRVLRGALEHAQRISANKTRQELCKIWLELEPGSLEPLLESARWRVAVGELEAAAAEFEKLRTDFGPRTDILLPLAAVYQDLVRTRDALARYLEAVETEPSNVDALCMAGSCALDLRDTAMADRLLSRALECDPTSAFAQYNLGLLRLDQGRIEEASALVLGARNSTRGQPWAASELAVKLAAPAAINMMDVEWANARFKLVHDIEQLEHLRARIVGGAALDPVIAEYKSVLDDRLLPGDAYSMVSLDARKYPLLARTYKSPLNAPDPEPPKGPLLNPDLPWKQIEERYFDATPNLVHVDDLLTPETLAAVRAFCLESTIWNQLKGGYLGAYMPDGFSGRLLLRIASELRSKMPRVIRDHALQTMWGYKYDSRYAGIGVHADVAAVNVNFWITPDEANLDPESGGLIVYTHDAPKDWGFASFNFDKDDIYAYLESVKSQKIKVPYRANRAVIFDSDLFHETDAFRFKEGYENRRVNVTMLYGTRAG